MSEISEPLIVRGGQNTTLGYDQDGNSLHTRMNVLNTMILDICYHYRGLPDVRTLDMDEIEFFYDGLRGILIDKTKPRE
jgi:hypothetical protein